MRTLGNIFWHSFDLISMLVIIVALFVFMALDLFQVINPSDTMTAIAYPCYSISFLASTLIQRARDRRNQAARRSKREQEQTPPD